MFKIKYRLREEDGGSGEGQGIGGGGSVGDAGDAGDNAPASVFGEGMSFSDGWTDQLTGDNEQYREMAGQFKDLPSFLKSFHDTKSKLSQRFQPPGEDASDEDKSAWRTALGAPESAEAYDLKIPEKLPEDVHLTEDQFDDFRGYAHSIGLSNDQLNGLIEYQVGVEGDLMATLRHQAGEQAEAADKKLQNDWGSKWQENKTLAMRVLETYGLGAGHELAGHPDVLRLAAQMGQAVSEDTLVGLDQVGATRSPGEMAYDISNNKENPYYDAYWDSTHSGHAEAQDRWQNLMKEQVNRERK